jgi:hypothetical protein
MEDDKECLLCYGISVNPICVECYKYYEELFKEECIKYDNDKSRLVCERLLRHPKNCPNHLLSFNNFLRYHIYKEYRHEDYDRII